MRLAIGLTFADVVIKGADAKRRIFAILCIEADPQPTGTGSYRKPETDRP